MRNISFSQTIPQIEQQQKTVTRRLGWKKLKVGDHLKAVDCCMGLKKGAHPRLLHFIQITNVRTEKLGDITTQEVKKEGFPDWNQEQFIKFFCEKFRVNQETTVTRIEFKYIAPPQLELFT